MSDILVIQHPDRIADYDYILRIYNGPNYYHVAVDHFGFDPDSGVYVGSRNTPDVDEDGDALVEIVIMIPATTSFELIARSEFKSMTQNQIWEEQLEYEAERKRFEGYANDLLKTPKPPTEY